MRKKFQSCHAPSPDGIYVILFLLQLSLIITFIMSPSCDVFTAESVFTIITQLPDTNQRKIVDNVQVISNLVMSKFVCAFLISHKMWGWHHYL